MRCLREPRAPASRSWCMPAVMRFSNSTNGFTRSCTCPTSGIGSSMRTKSLRTGSLCMRKLESSRAYNRRCFPTSILAPNLGAPPPAHLFPCRQLLEAGVKIAFGTDALTASPLTSPLESIQMALERAGPDGRRITLEEALRAYTLDAAYAEFREKEKGSIEPGKLADLVLLDRDLFACRISDLHLSKVRVTVLNGRVVHE